MPEISRDDKRLADLARKKAGGSTKLGLVFGVTKQTANGWGNRQPIPRHLRKQLVAYVGTDAEGTKLADDATPSAPSSEDEVLLMADSLGREAFSLLAQIFRAKEEEPRVWKLVVDFLRIEADRLAPAPTSTKVPTRHSG